MSVQEQIDRINQNVANTYSALSALGADMPEVQNSDNLAATSAAIKAVLYIAQTLTDAQKAQARANIGAADAVAADTVTADGTIAVSGAAVAAYVDKRLAQAGLYVLIVEQPVPMTVNQGETASFTVAAEGKGLTYQWEYSVNEGTNWTESADSGSQTQTISFVAAKSQNGYKYRCVITDANGNNVISDAAMLTVKQGAVITQQPQSQAAIAGDTVTFSVEATGVASYQWQTTSNDGVSWDDLTWEGATTGTMTCTLNINTVTYKYRCKLTGTDGSVVYTDVIYFAPVLITKQPESVRGEIGGTATFTLEANGYISMYRWQRSTDGGVNFNPVYWSSSGFDTDTFTFTINDDSRLNGLYRCVVYCSEGDEYNVISDVVSIISA